MISGVAFGLVFFTVGMFMKMSLGIASLRNGEFRKKLGEREFTMLVKTGDHKKARYYRLERGKLKTRGAEHPDPDLSLVWADSPSFVRTVFRLNPLLVAKGLTGALTGGLLTIEADVEATAWFMSEMTDMLLVYKNFFSLKSLK